jgi:hypothetical protein
MHRRRRLDCSGPRPYCIFLFSDMANAWSVTRCIRDGSGQHGSLTSIQTTRECLGGPLRATSIQIYTPTAFKMKGTEVSETWYESYGRARRGTRNVCHKHGPVRYRVLHLRYVLYDRLEGEAYLWATVKTLLYSTERARKTLSARNSSKSGRRRGTLVTPRYIGVYMPKASIAACASGMEFGVIWSAALGVSTSTCLGTTFGITRAVYARRIEQERVLAQCRATAHSDEWTRPPEACAPHR